MKNYKTYMDRVTVSDELHEKLMDLEEPKKARPEWQKYAALAACGLLLVGVGAWGVKTFQPKNGWEALLFGFDPAAEVGSVTSAAIGEAIDLAPVEGDDVEPGMRTIPGFEVTSGDGPEGIVRYYVLPWIGYGPADGETSVVSMDFAPPEDATFRTLTHEDVLALVGGEQALETLLDWGGFTFTGSATFNADGTLWQLCFSGKRDDFFFELELAPDALPLTCVIVEPHTTTEIWGTEVVGRYSGIHGEGPDREVWMPESREVEFVAKGVGCRFTLYGLEGRSEAVETMVSRFVRHAILEGLDLSSLGQEGTSAPADGGIDAPWDEPNWNDAGAAPSVGPQASTEPYDPSGN